MLAKVAIGNLRRERCWAWSREALAATLGRDAPAVTWAPEINVLQGMRLNKIYERIMARKIQRAFRRSRSLQTLCKRRLKRTDYYVFLGGLKPDAEAATP